jgi:hypothetical protein
LQLGLLVGELQLLAFACSFSQIDEDILVVGELVDGEADLSEESESGQNSFVGANFFLERIIFRLYFGQLSILISFKFCESEL